MFIVSRFQLALKRKQHIRLNLGLMLLILDIALTTPSSANTFAWRHPRPKTRCSAVKNATTEIPLTLTQSSLATPHSTSTKGIAKIRYTGEIWSNVVYLEQRLGALNSIHCLKSAFSTFFAQKKLKREDKERKLRSHLEKKSKFAPKSWLRVLIPDKHVFWVFLWRKPLTSVWVKT